MKEAMVRTFKFFLAHQDEEQETWLRAMANQGLHLVDVNPLSFWTFRRGAPADVAYRVDYSSAAGKADFHQLMQDAGWKLAATTVGWEYWCTPVVNGRAPDIYTDSVSKTKKFQVVLAILICTGVPAFIAMMNSDKQALFAEVSMPGRVIIGIIFTVYLLLVPYTIVGLLRRIRQIRAAPAG